MRKDPTNTPPFPSREKILTNGHAPQAIFQEGDQFKEAMRQAGIQFPPSELIADGQIHRFSSDGTKRKNGWYAFYGLAGSFGEWKLGLTIKWHTSRPLSGEEYKKRQEQIQKAIEAQRVETHSRHEETALKAQSLWESYAETGVSAYLNKKQVCSLGGRFGNNFFVVPARDVAGKLWSLQEIHPNGFKKFLTGGRQKGCFHTIGTLEDGGLIYVCEGFATAASIYEATGCTTVVAFSVWNLESVVTSLQKTYPNSSIIIAGDDDMDKPNNQGRTVAESLAFKHRCQAFFPVFSEESRMEDPTDWNDLHVLEGLEEVSKQISSYKILPREDSPPEEKTLEFLEGLDDDVAIAKHLMRNLQKQFGEIRYSEGDLWAYHKNLNYWKVFSPDYLVRRVQTYSGLQNKKLNGRFEYIRLTTQRINSIVTQLYALKKLCTEEDTFFYEKKYQKRGINTSMGFIEVKEDGSLKRLENHKDLRQRHVVPFDLQEGLLKNGQVDWTADVWKDSSFKKFWDVFFKDDPDWVDKVNFFGEVAGVAASGYSTNLKQPKALILLGESANNGKSQLIELLTSFLAPRDICKVKPEDFKNERSRLLLKNKKLNVAGELSGKGIETDHFKEIVSGDLIDGREIYKSSVSFKSTALHVFATNKSSSFLGGVDEGIKRRLLIFPFHRVIPESEQIVDIAQQIIEEEGHLVLAWALSGLRSVILNNRSYHIPQCCQKALDEWNVETDSVAGFVHDGVALEGGAGFISTQEIYSHYVHYGKDSGLKNLPSLKSFGKRLKGYLPPGIIEARKNNTRGFENLKIIYQSTGVQGLNTPSYPFNRYRS